MNAKQVILCGALFAALAVALGAFGAHALRAMLDARALEIWRSAVQYQMFHSLALLALGAIALAREDFSPGGAAAAFVAGILLFSGSLYALAFTSLGPLALLTPAGGLALLGGWVILAVRVAGMTGAVGRPPRAG